MKSFAFVFPGQGSQSVGMLDAWGDHPEVVKTLQEASAALGEDVAKLIHEGPKETLALTTNTQPVMLVAGVAAYRVWMAETGVAPSAVAGHSLGEYSALVAAGVLTLPQAVPLVRLRAQAMQEAVPVGTGAMAAILGLDAAKVREVCATVSQASGEVAEAVNFNDPGQTVIAGSKAGVEQACEALKAAGAKRALPLPVSAPFHSSLMKPAAEKLKLKPGALGGMRPGPQGQWRDAHRRMWPRQGAGGHGQAHRRRIDRPAAVRSGQPGRSENRSGLSGGRKNE
jgi:[acyl-carrier-protein] S-malonyltransferase